jgi:predicted RNA-binding protein with PIN domain
VTPTPTIGMLRPALELAWAVAKIGGQARPAVPPPGRLRPLMRFAKLPDRALLTVRQVVDEDDAFRTRVAEAADEAGLGRAAWLWLTRPEHWEDDLQALAQAEDELASEAEEEKEERRARRRVDAAEAAAARAEAEAAGLRQLNSDLVAELTTERQARRRAESTHHHLSNRLATAQAGHDQLQATILALESRVASLTSDAREAAAASASTDRELDAARTEIERLRAEVRQSGAEAARLEADGVQLRADAGHALSRAAAAARLLSEALADVAGTVDGDSVVDGPDAEPSSVAVGRKAAPSRWVRPDGPSPALLRRPVPLPPAVFDDSFEAADHLVRVPGVVLIVDGYNVTISSWPHLELPRQRHHLVNALAELAMRVGPSVHVVFDGTDAGGRIGPPAAARRKMRVTFSPEGVDADDVIVDLVAGLDPTVAVVVASDDRQVRESVGRLGANVVSVAQLLAVLRRAPGSAAG